MTGHYAIAVPCLTNDHVAQKDLPKNLNAKVTAHSKQRQRHDGLTLTRTKSQSWVRSKGLIASASHNPPPDQIPLSPNLCVAVVIPKQQRDNTHL
jgi:hypothetical protein